METENATMTKRQYISYQITLGGNTGWRFSNHDEWHSINYFLYFDASLWTMKRIEEAIKALEDAYMHDKRNAFTLNEIGNIGAEYIRRFFASNAGVYATSSIWSSLDKNSDRLIAEPANDQVIRWSKCDK